MSAIDAMRISDDETRRLLGIQPRRAEEAILASANSMIDKGLLGPS